MYGSALKLGAIEDTKNREKLAALTSFTTNHGNGTTFNHVRKLRNASFCFLVISLVSRAKEKGPETGTRVKEKVNNLPTIANRSSTLPKSAESQRTLLRVFLSNNLMRVVMRSSS